MASFRALCLAGVASLAATAVAHAADLPLPLPPPPPPLEQPVAFGSGWYLRGDGGASFNDIHGLAASFRDPEGVYRATGGYPGGFQYNGASVETSGFIGAGVGYPGGFQYNGASVETSGFIGAGVGYRFNNFFRADVTGEYRFGGRYDNRESYTAYCGSGRCYDTYSSRLSSAVVLANGYIDIGTWYGVTPFVGAGVGAAFNQFGVLIDRGVQTTGYGSSYAPHSNVNFAYAFMAGLDYSISSHFVLEAGYRYINLGAFQSAGIVCNGGCNVTESQRLKLSANEVRVGLRYIFADEVPPPPPIVVKY